MRIKLFENFNAGKKLVVLDSFEEAEGKLSSKEGNVLVGNASTILPLLLQAYTICNLLRL